MLHAAIVTTAPMTPLDAAWKDLRAMLERFVARRVAPADVEDVLHDVFVRIARGLPALREEQRMTAWVYQVARNAIADHFRRPLAQRAAPLERDTEDLAQELDDDDPAAATALAGELRAFVELLPASYREALELTDLDGITQAEAARRLGLSVPGMKSRVQRARAQLRDLLEGCCAIELDVRGRVVDCEPRRPPPERPDCCARPKA